MVNMIIIILIILRFFIVDIGENYANIVKIFYYSEIPYVKGHSPFFYIKKDL